MINDELLKRLSQITDEEEKILAGETDINTSLYMEDGENRVNSKKLFREGKLITVRPHTRFIHFPRHYHDFVEVVYMCKGSTTHIVNGERIVLAEGELLFLGQNASQEILHAGEADIAVNFIILPEFFDSPLAMLKYSNSPIKDFLIDILVSDKEKSAYMHFKVSDNRIVQNLAESLILTLLDDTPSKYVFSSYTMGLMLLHLSQCTDCLTNISKEDSAVLAVLSYVDENYRDGKLSELAKKMHYDYNWLSREIKRKTGKTYTEIVQDRRLAQAEFLLTNTDMNIDDIAENIGYDNISYFFTLFKRKFGRTPRQYRVSVEKQ